MDRRLNLACMVAVSLAGLLPAGAGTGWAAVPGTSQSLPPSPMITRIQDARELSPADRAAAFTEYVTAFRSALAAGNATRAGELAKHAVRVFPKLVRPWAHLAAVRVRTGQFGPAIEAARIALDGAADAYPPASSPEETHAGAAYWEGLALYTTRRYDEALPRLRAAREGAPQWAEAARALAECTFVAGKTKDAAPLYAAAFELDPNVCTPRDLAYFAEARAAAGDLDGGIAAIQEALRRAPYQTGLHAKLGDLYRRLGRLSEAYYELLHEVILHGVQSDFSQAAVNMQAEIAKQVSAGKADSEDHEILLTASALAAANAGDPHKALHRLQSALAHARTTSPVPQFLLGEAFVRNNQLDKAQPVLQDLVAAHPEFVPALYTLSEVHRKRGDVAASDAALERVRTAFPDYWKLHLRAERR